MTKSINNLGWRKALKAGALLIGNDTENKRGWQRMKERAARKDQIRAAKAIQVKSTRGFA